MCWKYTSIWIIDATDNSTNTMQGGKRQKKAYRKYLTWHGAKFTRGTGAQQRAIDSLKEKEENQILIALEKSKSRHYRMFQGVEDFYLYYANVPKEDRHFYSVNRSFQVEDIVSKFYMDIEWMRENIDPNGMEVVVLLVKIFKESLLQVLGEEWKDEIEELSPFVIDHTRKSKGKIKMSYHVHIDVLFEHNAQGCMRAFVKEIMIRKCEQHDKLWTVGKNGDRVSVLDLLVYTQNRIFRINGSHKEGASRTTDLPSQDDVWRSIPCRPIATACTIPLITQDAIQTWITANQPEESKEREMKVQQQVPRTAKSGKHDSVVSTPLHNVDNVMVDITKLLHAMGDTRSQVVCDGDFFRANAPGKEDRVCVVAAMYDKRVTHTNNNLRLTVSTRTGEVKAMCHSMNGIGHERIGGRLAAVTIGKISDESLAEYRSAVWKKSGQHGGIEGLDMVGRPIPLPFDNSIEHGADAAESFRIDAMISPEEEEAMAAYMDAFESKLTEPGETEEKADEHAEEKEVRECVEIAEETVQVVVPIITHGKGQLDQFEIEDGQLDKMVKYQGLLEFAMHLFDLIQSHNGRVTTKVKKAKKMSKKELVSHIVLLSLMADVQIKWNAIPCSILQVKSAPYKQENQKRIEKWFIGNADVFSSELEAKQHFWRVGDDGWIELITHVMRNYLSLDIKDGCCVVGEKWKDIGIPMSVFFKQWSGGKRKRKEEVRKEKKRKKQKKLDVLKKTKDVISDEELREMRKLPPLEEQLALCRMDTAWILDKLGFSDDCHAIEVKRILRLWVKTRRCAVHRLDNIDERHGTTLQTFDSKRHKADTLCKRLNVLTSRAGIKMVLTGSEVCMEAYR